MIWLRIVSTLGGAAGVALLALGLVAVVISASVNMSFNNPLPRAGCVLLATGAALVGLGIWGVAT